MNAEEEILAVHTRLGELLISEYGYDCEEMGFSHHLADDVCARCHQKIIDTDPPEPTAKEMTDAELEFQISLFGQWADGTPESGPRELSEEDRKLFRSFSDEKLRRELVAELTRQMEIEGTAMEEGGSVRYWKLEFFRRWVENQ